MRFKIYSFIFVFVVCFLLFSCGPTEENTEESGKNETVWTGAELGEDEKESFLSEVRALGPFYEKGAFDKIGDFYGETGILMTHEGGTIQGSKNIEDYFRKLRNDSNVPFVEFKPECVYAKEVSGTVEERIRTRVKSDKSITHVAYAVISFSFRLDDRDVDPPSFWDGFHIEGCDWQGL